MLLHVHLLLLAIVSRVNQAQEHFVQPVIMAITLVLMKYVINVRQIVKHVQIGLHAPNVLLTITF